MMHVNINDALAAANIVFIAVGTPMGSDGSADSAGGCPSSTGDCSPSAGGSAVPCCLDNFKV